MDIQQFPSARAAPNLGCDHWVLDGALLGPLLPGALALRSQNGSRTFSTKLRSPKAPKSRTNLPKSRSSEVLNIPRGPFDHNLCGQSPNGHLALKISFGR